jgi:type II secretory pathway component PulL
LASIGKKTDANGVEISRVLLSAEQRFPKDKKINRFEYKDGEVTLTVREIDVLEANQLKEALENEKSFTQFRIEQGVVSNEERVIFQVKR